MTKNEFLSRLEAELEARRVPEPEDILGEYRRHFEYKLADGYSEEEIAARLGAPEELAAQFEPEREAPRPSRAGSAARSALTWTGLLFADMFVLSFFMLFASWVAVVACAALASGLVSLCLLIPFDMQPYVNLPEMPYWCGAVYALALAALTVLSGVGCSYFARLLAQLWRAYFRFHRNAVRPALPARFPPAYASAAQADAPGTACIAHRLRALCRGGVCDLCSIGRRAGVLARLGLVYLRTCLR